MAALCLLMVGVAAAGATDRVALVIGNGAYRNTITLPNPARDATAIASLLRGFNFDVVEGEDLDKAAMEEKLREFAEKAQSAKATFVFYAGHGMQVGGKNYMIPIDAKLADATALDFEAINVDRVINYARHDDGVAIVLLDACRDNPLSRRFARSFVASRSAGLGQGLAVPKIAGGGVLIGFATAPGEEASDGSGNHSPYTAALLRQLPSPGIGIEQVLTRVTADVYAATKGAQEPWRNSSLRAEFSLNPAAAKEPGADKTKVAALPPAAITVPERKITFDVRVAKIVRNTTTPRERAPRIWKKTTHVTKATEHIEYTKFLSVLFKNGRVFVDDDAADNPGVYVVECGQDAYISDSDYPRVKNKAGSDAAHMKCRYSRDGDIYRISFKALLDDMIGVEGFRRASYLKRDFDATVRVDATGCALIKFTMLAEMALVDDLRKLRDVLQTDTGEMTSGKCIVLQ